MKIFLAICTILGGFAAIWFFWDKLKSHGRVLLRKLKLYRNSDGFVDLPDDEFLFFDKISNLPTRKEFVPASLDEIRLCNALVNYELFKKQEDSCYKLTRKGRQLLRQQR